MYSTSNTHTCIYIVTLFYDTHRFAFEIFLKLYIGKLVLRNVIFIFRKLFYIFILGKRDQRKGEKDGK